MEKYANVSKSHKYCNKFDGKSLKKILEISRIWNHSNPQNTKVVQTYKLKTVIDTFNDYYPRIQFTHEIERNNRINFLDLEIMKLDDRKIVSNWYKKSTYSGSMFNFISNHPFKKKSLLLKI